MIIECHQIYEENEGLLDDMGRFIKKRQNNKTTTASVGGSLQAELTTVSDQVGGVWMALIGPLSLQNPKLIWPCHSRMQNGGEAPPKYLNKKAWKPSDAVNSDQ